MTAFGTRALFRVYQDFLMSERLDAFERLLHRAVARGYRLISCEAWAELLESAARIDPKTIVLRHDIDTDPHFALSWSSLEAAIGVRGSYFFRLSTLQDEVIRELMRRGCHVSYHFEEIADVAKERKLRNRAQVEASLPVAAERFARNVDTLRARYGWSMRVVCSHADWLNRRLGVSNHRLVRDPALRARLGIGWETYDAAMTAPLAARFSDVGPPDWWLPGPPEEAVEAGIGPIGIVTRPRYWRANVQANAQALKRRIVEGLVYRTAAG